jgi:hypothetical protein
MPKQKLTLWLLNRCVDWNQPRLREALSSSYEVDFGRRRISTDPPPAVSSPEVFVNENEEGVEAELMHERNGNDRRVRSAYDEYFVPIPVKCVGHPSSAFWRRIAHPGAGQAHLEAIAGRRRARFGGRLCHDSKVAKERIGPHFGDVKMNLADDTIGYYEILQRAKEQTGANNVLVGYSQGGTVARYLAFLDEHVAQPEKRCIHGVITVQAPNRGSPLAAPVKSGEVSAAVIAILLSLPHWLPTKQLEGSAIWKFLSGSMSHGALIEFIDGLLDAQISTFGDDAAKPKVLIWITARKWLSGLSGLADLAFWDLDPQTLALPGCVLQAIDGFPLQAITHGAVVGCDSRLDDIVEALLASEGFFLGLLAKLEQSKIASLVAQASKIYADHVMSYPPGSEVAAVDYAAGLQQGRGELHLDAAIPPEAHDFIIPSISQILLPAPGAKNHLGNHVNHHASHLTGADRSGKDHGRSDEDLVVEMLRRM